MTRITLTHTCIECGRTFDMWDSDDAIEWANGHDCEAPEGNDDDTENNAT